MPPKIDQILFAPCGMNCMVCYKHCFSKKPCPGCLPSDEGKPKHCRTCKVKDCVEEKGFLYCFDCADFPCNLIKNLERSYNRLYHTSLIQNSLMVKRKGLETFMKRQKEQYTCPQCDGVISLHDAVCSECGYSPQNRSAGHALFSHSN